MVYFLKTQDTVDSLNMKMVCASFFTSFCSLVGENFNRLFLNKILFILRHETFISLPTCFVLIVSLKNCLKKVCDSHTTKNGHNVEIYSCNGF